jgi:hypothetical protein
LAFPEDGRFPDSLPVGGRRFPVFANEVNGIGAYRSVNLVPDVSGLGSPDEARRVASDLIAPFHEAVAAVRRELGLPDPSRRRLLRSFADGTQDETTPPG